MALTENTKITLIPDPTNFKQPVALGAIQFFKNAICSFNSSGFLKLGGDTAGETFAGIAANELNQASGGANGDNELLLITSGSSRVVLLAFTGVVQADLGADVFIVDDGSVALAATTTNDVRVGKVWALTENSNEALILLD